jgi:hypothetical protein
VLCAGRGALVHANSAAQPVAYSPGLLDSFPRRSRDSASHRIRVFADRAQRENCDARVHGRDRQFRVKRGGEVSDQFRLISEAGLFRASESGPGSRLFLVSWPGEASRPLVSSGAPELFLTVSPDCDRRNEWNGNAACEIAVEWSGAVGKLASPSSCVGRTVPGLGAKQAEGKWAASAAQVSAL